MHIYIPTYKHMYVYKVLLIIKKYFIKTQTHGVYQVILCKSPHQAVKQKKSKINYKKKPFSD